METETVTRLLDIDEGTFHANFAKGSFSVKHSLGDHPLLTVEGVAELADELPETSVEHNTGKVDAVVGDKKVERLDLPPGEIARGIDTNGCWMVLKNIEQVPRYHALLDELLDEVTPFVQDREGGMSLREGFVFLSAPNSTTPAHTDHEHNFLLQVRGPKHFNVGVFHDQQFHQRQIEKMYAGARNLDRLPDDPELYDLKPGDGLYVAPCAPHWVETLDTVSVSLSITFQTPVTQRASQVHAINRHLRRLPIQPKAPGQSQGRDRLKAGAFKTLQRVRGGA
jgi:hypothetical protein